MRTIIEKKREKLYNVDLKNFININLYIDYVSYCKIEGLKKIFFFIHTLGFTITSFFMEGMDILIHSRERG